MGCYVISSNYDICDARLSIYMESSLLEPSFIVMKRGFIYYVPLPKGRGINIVLGVFSVDVGVGVGMALSCVQDNS